VGLYCTFWQKRCCYGSCGAACCGVLCATGAAAGFEKSLAEQGV